MRKKFRQSGGGPGPASGPLYCDLTQSWSAQGGGVRTYLLRKRDHILSEGLGRHLLIIPGEHDGVEVDGAAITVTIKSPRVPGSPNYRLLLDNRAVRSALAHFQPDLIECQDVYNLPWQAIRHIRSNPRTALVACYMTDAPTAYLDRIFSPLLGKPIGRGLARLGYGYLRQLFAHFDAIGALGEAGGAAKLRALGVERVEVTPLGVDVDAFTPEHRDPALRRELGVADDAPLLIYAGRLDKEKRPDVVVDAFRRLPESLGAHLVLLGDGPMRHDIEALADPRIHLTGFVSDRTVMARLLASSDIYVSAMADETFGVSIVEAQASGLPVVGVASGAMPDRVDPSVGLLGPVGDGAEMAANIERVWNGDRVAMSRAARDRALGCSWRAAMENLFGRVYPDAMERAAGVRAVQDGFTRQTVAAGPDRSGVS